MRRFEQVVVRRQRKTRLEHANRLFVRHVEALSVRLHARFVEIKYRHLVFFLHAHLTVRHAIVVCNVLEVIDALQCHENALETVRNLHSRRRHFQRPALLKIRKLRHLHAVHPHLPPETPRPEHRGFPIVLDEAHVVRPCVDAQRLERSQIHLLHVLRRRFQDDLKLSMLLHPIRVLPVPRIVRTHRRFRITHVPRFGPNARKNVAGFIVPAPTSVLCGNTIAHPRADQYSCNRKMAS